MSLIITERQDEGKEWIIDLIRREYDHLNDPDGMEDINYTTFLTLAETQIHPSLVDLLQDANKTDGAHHDVTID